MSSVDEMAARMEANIAEKTGKSVEQWVKAVKAEALEKHGQIVKFLKSDHGFTHGYANYVAHKTLKSSALDADDDDLIAAQFAGPKAELKPIYDKLVGLVKKLGDGAELAPKKSYVSLRHNKQFGLIQPTTKTRVDLGLVLKGKAPAGRLEASGSFNSMVTHRVRLESADQVDGEVKAWLKEAFDAA